MKFSLLAKYFLQIENTPKRLEMTSLLADLIGELGLDEVDKALYLSLGSMGPPFRSIQFNVAEKMMIRAISSAFNVGPERVLGDFSKAGDLGLVAQDLKRKSANGSEDMDIKAVFEKLHSIASFSGLGSQERKVLGISALLKSNNPLSNRYIVRIILSTMRLGFSDITVVEALSWFLSGTKEHKREIEKHYRIYPDIGFIAKMVKKSGLEGLKNVKVEVGIPVLAAKCARLNSFEEILEKLGGKVASEYKYDGTRVQIHLDRARSPRSNSNSLFSDLSETPFVKTFTRNLEDSTHMFPDLVQSVIKGVGAQKVILDGEAIGFDERSGKFIPFQETIKRKRKHGVDDFAKKIPLTLRIFDILYLDGRELIDESMESRWSALQKIIKESEGLKLAHHRVFKSPSALREEFEKAVSFGLEGLVVKDLSAPYRVGSRGFAWVKIKHREGSELDDTIDAVVLGYYFGAGQRSKFGIGAFLVGVYDRESDSFKTLSKIGTGLTDEQWVQLREMVDKAKVPEILKEYDVPKELHCDVWVLPKIVAVIKADNITKSPLHTASYALRFPRLVGYRSDKSAKDITSVSEVERMYGLQKKI